MAPYKIDMKEFLGKILSMMETSGQNWTRDWVMMVGGFPHNVKTKRLFGGGNVWRLMFSSIVHGYESHSWGTFATWTSLGYSLKGKNSTHIVYYGPRIKKKKGDDGVEKKVYAGQLKLDFFEFNGSQIEGWVEPEKEKPPYETQGSHYIDDIYARLGVNVSYGHNEAAYAPTIDQIILPHPGQFKTPARFDSTRIHELMHWTGHQSRLNRPLLSSKLSDEYAKEELIAELGAALLNAAIGVEAEPMESHAKYLKGWMDGIKEDEKYFDQAAAGAWKAIKYIVENSGVDCIQITNGDEEVGKTKVEFSDDFEDGEA